MQLDGGGGASCSIYAAIGLSADVISLSRSLMKVLALAIGLGKSLVLAMSLGPMLWVQGKLPADFRCLRL